MKKSPYKWKFDCLKSHRVNGSGIAKNYRVSGSVFDENPPRKLTQDG